MAISEMAISGGLGAVIDLLKVPAKEDIDVSTTLFSESHGRYLITVKKNAVEDVLSKINVPSSIIGEVGGNNLTITDSFSITVEELKKSYNGIIEKFMA